MAALAAAALFHFCLLLVPQPHDEGQAKGNDQFQVIPLPQEEQYNQQQQNIPAVQSVQLEGTEQPCQPPAFPRPAPQKGGDGEGEPSDGRTRDVVFSSSTGMRV